MTSSKEALRALIKTRRKEMDAASRAAWDESLAARVLALPEIREAAAVYAYISVKGEADTRRLIRALLEKGIRIAVPRIESSEAPAAESAPAAPDGAEISAPPQRAEIPAPAPKIINFYYISGDEDLVSAPFGLLEPAAGCPRARDRACPVITPGLAFSEDLFRVGYGRSFYDRFFAAEPEHPRIGLAYDYQVFPEVPHDPHDLPLDAIVTPERLITGRGSR